MSWRTAITSAARSARGRLTGNQNAAITTPVVTNVSTTSRRSEVDEGIVLLRVLSRASVPGTGVRSTTDPGPDPALPWTASFPPLTDSASSRGHRTTEHRRTTPGEFRSDPMDNEAEWASVDDAIARQMERLDGSVARIQALKTVLQDATERALVARLRVEALRQREAQDGAADDRDP